jgi:hypothetical protein
MEQENPPKKRIRTFKTFFKAYSLTGGIVGLVAVGYLLLLIFPQPLFAYTLKYEHYTVHSREPIDPAIQDVLNSAETRLERSPIYDADIDRSIYLTNGFKMYALLSHKAYNSFANSVPFINNVFLNKTDVPGDRIFMNREKNNSRSLSGVIAHETTHLFIRHHYGTVTASLMPVWKNDGYCEYIAGDSAIPLAEGMRLWRQNPTDDTGYRYSKYHAMVKYLLEVEGLTVDELLTRSLNEKEIAAKTFDSLDKIGF